MPTIIKPRTAAQGKSQVNSIAINPFIISAVKVIKENTGLSVAKKNLFMQYGKFSSAGTGIVMEISGDLSGKIVYEFSKGVAANLAEKMVKKNIDISTSAMDFKELLDSANLELGNQIAGHAITLLEKNKINCSISAPKFYLGKDLQLIHPHLKTIILILKTEIGEFSINIALLNQ